MVENILKIISDFLAQDVWKIFSVISIVCIVIEMMKMRAKKIEKVIVMEKPFENDLSNELYALSFTKPFSEAINPDESHPRVKDVEKMIAESGLSHKLDYRVYTVIQLGLVCLGLVALIIFLLLSKQIGYLFRILLNVDVPIDSPDYTKNLAMGLGFCVVGLGLAPKIYLSRRAKRNAFYFQKDLPILQLFIILILRAKRPIRELLFVLSRTEMRYKDLFSNAYRIYLRNEDESFINLKRTFESTKMINTMNILSEYAEYSKEESLSLLEGNLEDIIEESNTMKRKKDIMGSVMSQGSLMFPLIGVVLLGLLPLAMYGMNSLNNATQLM